MVSCTVGGVGTQNIQMAYSDHVYYTFCAIAILPINCMYQLHEEELCARIDCRRRRRRGYRWNDTHTPHITIDMRSGKNDLFQNRFDLSL